LHIKRLKIIALLLSFVLVFGLFGCGAKQETPKQEAPKQEAVEQEAPKQEAPKPDILAETVNSYFANMPDHIYKIDQVDFAEKVKAKEDMFILDIRQSDVYNEGHIIGAVNAPWGSGLADVLEKLPPDQPIMLYCYTGQTAGQAVAFLNIAGFDVRSVNLGWNLGISKVEGIEALIETEPNSFPNVTPKDINPVIKEAVIANLKGLADVKDEMYKNNIISEDNAKKLLDAKDTGVVFLSIRKAKDFAQGHIEGAINIPWGKDMYKEFSKLPKDKKIIVYCYTGQTAGQTVAALKVLGYDAVSLKSGMGMPVTGEAGWANKGFPVVK